MHKIGEVSQWQVFWEPNVQGSGGEVCAVIRELKKTKKNIKNIILYIGKRFTDKQKLINKN